MAVAVKNVVGGSGIPKERARKVFTPPAVKPLSAEIRTGSPNDILRVKLLSKPQQRHAATTASNPCIVPATGPPFQAMVMAPAVKAAIPRTIRASYCSLKANHAIHAVKTPSRVSSNEAVEAEMEDSPVMRNTGPSMPPVSIAPVNQRQSPLPTRPLKRMKRWQSPVATAYNDNPRPAPRYMSPASISGSASFSKDLAMGVLMPKRSAEPSARIGPSVIFICFLKNYYAARLILIYSPCVVRVTVTFFLDRFLQNHPCKPSNSATRVPLSPSTCLPEP